MPARCYFAIQRTKKTRNESKSYMAISAPKWITELAGSRTKKARLKWGHRLGEFRSVEIQASAPFAAFTTAICIAKR